MMPFDPNQPYEIISMPENAQAPGQSHEFDPNQPYEIISMPSSAPKQAAPSGIWNNATAGLNDAIFSTIGAPVDAATWLTNKAVQGVNSVAGTELPQARSNLPGSSRWLAGLGEMAGVHDPEKVKATSPGEQLARAAGSGAGYMLAPEAALAGLNKAGLIGERIFGSLAPVFGRSATGADLAGNMAAGAGAGVGGHVAAQAAPEPWKPLAGMAGGMAVGAFPFALGGIGLAASPLVKPLMARLRPDEYAGRALATTLRRSGKSPAQVADDLAAAQADGQGVFTVADALGNAGQRMLSTAARTPHDGRQAVVEAMEARQAGQGRRIASALTEGFAAPDTAAQRVAALTQARRIAGDAGYTAARQGAGAVDVSKTIALIDETLAPGISGLARQQTNITENSIEGVLRKVRGMLTDGRSNMTDFSSLLLTRHDLGDMIDTAAGAGANNQARVLKAVERQLDDALSAASQPYAAARNAYWRDSQAIEAVETGRAAAQRGRAEDTIALFRSMTPQQQDAFRAGYVDPLIAATQSAATGANKARPLISDATAAEFPAFAAPGQADRLGQRLAREARMFETRAAATGGSKTADNLADATDLAQFDPGIMLNLMRGRPRDAVISAVSRALSEAKGLPPSVLERVSKALMETRPDAAREILSRAMKGQVHDRAMKALANSIFIGLLVGRM